MSHSQSNRPYKPDALPMWIANVRRVKLDKHGCEIVTNMDIIYHGVGAPLYRYELEFASRRTYDTFTIRAPSVRAAIKLIMERNPNVQGVVKQ